MSETNGELVFDDLAPREVKARIGTRHCLLREATTDAAVKYKNAKMKAIKMADSKMVGMENVADAEPLLVSLCLFELYARKGPNGEDLTGERPIGEKVIRQWPNSVTAKLFDKIIEMSPGLEEKETREVLQKRLEETQRKLKELDGDADPTTPASPGATTESSGSPAS